MNTRKNSDSVLEKEIVVNSAFQGAFDHIDWSPSVDFFVGIVYNGATGVRTR